MSQQCGKCKWWDRENKIVFANKDVVASCKVPVPFWVIRENNIDQSPYSNEGQNCPVYEERKE